MWMYLIEAPFIILYRLVFLRSMILEYTPLILCLLALIGANTALLAASSSLVKNDIKKIIALSTCSQLGYMVWACGFSLYSHSFCHLVNHAFFKALFFLSAGSLIHAMKNEQDLRKMGGAISYLPIWNNEFIPATGYYLLRCYSTWRRR